jgi:hypothetical protein
MEPTNGASIRQRASPGRSIRRTVGTRSGRIAASSGLFSDRGLVWNIRPRGLRAAPTTVCVDGFSPGAEYWSSWACSPGWAPRSRRVGATRSAWLPCWSPCSCLGSRPGSGTHNGRTAAPGAPCRA